TSEYPAPLYQMAWDNLPDVYNSRVREIMAEYPNANWIFEGKKIKEAPGWAKGECKERDDQATRNPFDVANLRAIGTAARYADMMELIARTVRRMPRGTDMSTLRNRITTALSAD